MYVYGDSCTATRAQGDRISFALRCLAPRRVSFTLRCHAADTDNGAMQAHPRVLLVLMFQTFAVGGLIVIVVTMVFAQNHVEQKSVARPPRAWVAVTQPMIARPPEHSVAVIQCVIARRPERGHPST